MTAEIHGPASTVPGTAALDHRLSGLIETLTRARKRSAMRLFVDGLITSIAIGLGLFCLLTLANVVLAGLSPILSFSWLSLPGWLADWRPAPMPQHLVVSIFGAIAALAVAQFAAAARRPGIARMAMAADRRFALDERLSTALQLARSPEKSIGVVGEALLRDAARHAEDVDARRLTPLRLQWQALAVPVLAILAAVLIASPPQPITFAPRAPSAALAGGGPAFGEADRIGTAAEIRAIAAILTRDGEERANPTLQALGNELDRLGTELQNNPNVNRGALAQELQRLADLATEAYGRAGVTPEDPANRATLLDHTITALDPERTNGGANLPQATPDETVPQPELDAPFEGVGIEAGRPGAGLVPPPGMTVNARDINPAAGGGAPADVTGDGLDDYGGDFGDDPYYDGDRGDAVPLPNEAELIGAGAGFGGDVAGLGAGGNPLAGEGGAPINPVATEGEMLLTDPDPGNGRMITLNLPPLEQLMAVGEDGLTAGAWHTFVEGEVTRGTIPAEDLEAVGRYFQAIQAEPGE